MTSPYGPRRRVLVVGARRGSLGASVAASVRQAGHEAHEAGVAGEAAVLDALDGGHALRAFEAFEPDTVVCTVGANIGGRVFDPEWYEDGQQAMTVNYFAPMNLLAQFLEWMTGRTVKAAPQFVAVSSNSAHIARSGSLPYCASKAALSMGLRCTARDLARQEHPMRVWGYEPGALAGTPMTEAVHQRLPAGVPMSRMLLSPNGLPTHLLGQRIAQDVLAAGALLHGQMIRIDQGDT